MIMTPERLDEIEARCAAATDAPWEVLESEHYNTGAIDYLVIDKSDTIAASCYEYQDAVFIAHARTDLPDAVARIRELEAMNERLQGIIESQHFDKLFNAQPEEE